MFKSISKSIGISSVFLIFGTVVYFAILPIMSSKNNNGMYLELKKWLAEGASEESKIFDDKGFYGYVCRFVAVVRKLKSSSQLTHRDKEFLRREIHRLPFFIFYRDLMLYIMEVKGIDPAIYGMGAGLNRLYDDERAASGMHKNFWADFFQRQKMIAMHLLVSTTGVEGLEEKRVQETVAQDLHG